MWSMSQKKQSFYRMPKRQAAKPVGGLGMLIYQGAAAAKLYTGLDMPVAEVKEKFFKK